MNETIWSPALDQTSRLEQFMEFVGRENDSYEELWRWSVDDLNEFWLAVWRFFDVPSSQPPQRALAHRRMPGAVWFPEMELNYAETMLRMPGRAPEDIVVVARSQTGPEVRLSAAGLRDQVARCRAALIAADVSQGDRVAAYAPNAPETLILLLASASLGAIFSSCAPEFGARNVIERWSQINPKLLVASDGYRYGDKKISRLDEIEEIRAGLPSVDTTVLIRHLDRDAAMRDDWVPWEDFLDVHPAHGFNRVPFGTPLYVLFSSGTTGPPKPIVHGHGGITVEHLKALALQSDLGSSDTFFWYSTTGWMVWNYLVSGLGVGATIVLWDGNLAFPKLDALWELAADLDVTFFGVSAGYLLQCRKAGLQTPALPRLRALASTGAPLPVEGFRWIATHFPHAQPVSLAGGTDVCTGFVGAAPTVPVIAGRISCRLLGCDVDSFGPSGESVRDSLGELVVKSPMPSMPLGFWGDDDGSRLADAYFTQIPGAWRHGDWISIAEDGTCVITGRSDATLNRGGVRLGTAEFYSVVEALPEVVDSLVIHLEDEDGGPGVLYLFVVLDRGLTLDAALTSRIVSALKNELSPRHIPDEVLAVRGMPRTLSGKKIEVPLKRLLQGTPVDEAVPLRSIHGAEYLPDFSAAVGPQQEHRRG
jgi:acetoacetyl-CoA synthetase